MLKSKPSKDISNLWFCIIVFVILALCNPISMGFISLEFNLLRMQITALSKSTEANYKKSSVDMTKVEIYINNSEDQKLLIDILRHSKPIILSEDKIYSTFLYSYKLFIGDFKIDATLMPDFYMGTYNYRLDEDANDKLWDFLSTIPDDTINNNSASAPHDTIDNNNSASAPHDTIDNNSAPAPLNKYPNDTYESDPNDMVIQVERIENNNSAKVVVVSVSGLTIEPLQAITPNSVGKTP